MNIQEMHTTFRTIGQQMGMQLVRGVLPESIDIYINDVIIEKTQTELLQGVRTAMQDSVNTQSSTMSTVNTFRNLYRTSRYLLSYEDIDTETGMVIKNNPLINFYNKKNGYTIIRIPTVNDTNLNINSDEFRISPMMFLGFSIEYGDTERGNPVACRMIGADVLETTLRDYCNGASKDAPIVCLTSVPSVSNSVERTDTISNEQIELYTNTHNLQISALNIKYIKVPNVVKYDLDLANCVNCDLPAYTHFNIVERAVMKFYASVGSQSGSTARQAQQQ